MAHERFPLPPTFPTIASLDLFSTVVRVGSLTAAAAAHGIAQPSASARIRDLEQKMGVTLLRRGPGGSVPTAEGEVVAEWAERILLAADELQVGMASLNRRPTAPLRIAASYTVAEHLLPRWLSVWRQRSARVVELEVVNSVAVLDRVERGDVDLGFVEFTGDITSLQSADVGSDELVCVVAPTHRLARRKQPLTADQLSGVDLISRESGSGTRTALTRALAAAGSTSPTPILELGSTASVRGAVIDGVGVALLSRLAVRADLETGALVEVATVGIDLHRPFRAVWRLGDLGDDSSALLDVARADG
ncbi:LysR family transcriptional regulator [Ilumatobacter sp.]|uniref:LysR family transcriptional regulator n=1 Tax=Ilumatobacter sp. TaxID=1967498 RepID=UPI003C485D93